MGRNRNKHRHQPPPAPPPGAPDTAKPVTPATAPTAQPPSSRHEPSGGHSPGHASHDGKHGHDAGGGEWTIHPLYWLLAAAPIAFVVHWTKGPEWAVFVMACVSIIPLAGLMGEATEHLAERTGPGVGGLLNATFGNAAELVIALVALRAGPERYDLVKASLTGSIIGNILLVLGASMLAGGLRHKVQRFNATAASLGSTLLTLACVGLLLPSVFWMLSGSPNPDAPEHRNIDLISEEIAVVLAGVYVLNLVFTLRTHKNLFEGEEAAQQAHEQAASHELWSVGRAVGTLLAATVGVAVMSELLVGTVEHAGEAMGLNAVFIGVIVVAVVGNAAEHSSAILAAMKNKMDLAVNIAVGSSIQIALFVAPVLVLASVLMGHTRPLDLHFSAMELVAIIVAVIVMGQVAQDGETHWMEGVMLLAVYVMIGLAFFHPLPGMSPAPGH